MLRAAAKLENGNAREHVMSAQEADFYLEEAGGDFQAARRCVSTGLFSFRSRRADSNSTVVCLALPDVDPD